MENKEGTNTPKETKEKPKLRQIIIETNGDEISLEKAEVSGKIELIAILQSVIGYLNTQK
jgi:hypothetical protein